MIEADLSTSRGAFSLVAAFTAGRGITALFGPSGAGKSTVLDLIAGLTHLDKGHIRVDGAVFADTGLGINLPAHRRRIGYVFQDALLFPHLDVRGNLVYGRRFARSEVKSDFSQIVDLLGIAHLLERRPATMSGGERQRVAIGRALLTDPRLLLMDEPLAALDIDRKAEVIPYIERLRDELGLPILYVSHAIDEVARLADRVIVLANGRITEKGGVQEILGPKISSGADRFARLAVLTAREPAYDERYGLSSLEHPAGRISVAGRVQASHHGEVRVIIRATDVTLSRARPQEISIRTMLEGTLSRIEPAEGPIVIAEVALEGGDRLAAAITRKAIDDLGLSPGDKLYCLIKAVSIDERLMQAP